MIWILAIIVVVAIYNAERMPQIVNKIKSDVPHIVEAGKKASKDLKEKAKSVQEKATSKKTDKKDKE